MTKNYKEMTNEELVKKIKSCNFMITCTSSIKTKCILIAEHNEMLAEYNSRNRK